MEDFSRILNYLTNKYTSSKVINIIIKNTQNL